MVNIDIDIIDYVTVHHTHVKPTYFPFERTIITNVVRGWTVVSVTVYIYIYNKVTGGVCMITEYSD